MRGFVSDILTQVYIESLPEKGTVAVGLAPKPWPYWRLPGWHASSIGFHGDGMCRHAPLSNERTVCQRVCPQMLIL